MPYILRSLMTLFLVTHHFCTYSTEPVEGVEWILKSEVVVSENNVRMNDIIELKEGKPIPDFVIHQSPNIGQPIHWHKNKVYELINNIFPGFLHPVGLGSQWIKIRKESRPLESEELLELIDHSISRHLGEINGNLELSLARDWRPVEVPLNSINIEIINPESIQLASFVVVKFHITDQDNKLGPYYVQLRCRCLTEVLMGHEGIQRGSKLTPDLVHWVTQDVLSLRNPLTRDNFDPDDPYQTVRSIRSGSPILLRDVRRQPLILRRDIVTAVLDNGALQISIKALAEEEGYKGDIIRVTNLRSNKEFYARVIRRNVVELAH
nr:flagellar basal body P-ring formation protein FlgA [Cytophagales bacterium]